jgi:hypothetical protein
LPSLPDLRLTCFSAGNINFLQGNQAEEAEKTSKVMQEVSNGFLLQNQEAILKTAFWKR